MLFCNPRRHGFHPLARLLRRDLARELVLPIPRKLQDSWAGLRVTLVRCKSLQLYRLISIRCLKAVSFGTLPLDEMRSTYQSYSCRRISAQNWNETFGFAHFGILFCQPKHKVQQMILKQPMCQGDIGAVKLNLHEVEQGGGTARFNWGKTGC